jgi:cellulose biosynthesis protein BcsQ
MSALREGFMDQAFPFVITVASEKGGVGKTTIATNLAVYLKALREDLPVTIASFDNHFSVDSMFAVGRRRGASVAGLFAGVPAAELASIGEYGVQFLASDRSLSPPDDDPHHLRRALDRSDLSGILILDTRPILDYFTRNALVAADLVLAPVKDRPSLVNAASLQSAILEGAGDPARMWLIPSLIDARLRLRDNLGLREFLVFSARERGYQVVETCIAKSPKVEGLATNLTSRVYPVLTHARSTAVHRQFRELAEFVLQRFDAARPARRRRVAPGEWTADNPPGKLKRLVAECPACGKGAPGDGGHFFFDLRSRRRGLLHPPCLRALLRQTELKTLMMPERMLAFTLRGPGLVGPEADGILSLYDGEGEEIASERIGAMEGYEDFWSGASGRPFAEIYRESLLISLETGTAEYFLEGEGRARFAGLRRRVLREMSAR